MSVRHQLLSPLVLAALLTACGRSETPGPVRTPMQAGEAAQRTLRAAGRDEEVVAVQRMGDAWLVTTRWRETPAAGHLVTIDAADGKVKVERYRALQLAGPRPSPDS